MNKKNKNSKNGKDFFELLENIDEDIVEDAWEEKSGRITIVEARTPLGIVRDVAAAAACMAVIAAGIFGFMMLRSIDAVTPNDSDSSYSAGSGAESSVISKVRPDIPNTIGFSEINTAEKTDNENYAAVYVEKTNANEDMPMYITVYSLHDWIENEPVSETVKVTEPGEYTLRYTCLRGAGSINFLRIEAGAEWEKFEIIPSLEGTWLP